MPKFLPDETEQALLADPKGDGGAKAVVLKRLMTHGVKWCQKNQPQMPPEVLCHQDWSIDQIVVIKPIPRPEETVAGVAMPPEKAGRETVSDGLVLIVPIIESVLRPGMRVVLNPLGGKDSYLMPGLADTDWPQAVQRVQYRRREDVYAYYPLES